MSLITMEKAYPDNSTKAENVRLAKRLTDYWHGRGRTDAEFIVTSVKLEGGGVSYEIVSNLQLSAVPPEQKH
jgi:hypothetical protein